MKPLIKESLLYALFWVVVSVAIWAIDPLLIQNSMVGLLIFVAFSAGMVWLGIRERQRRGGFISYWPAWKVLLTVVLIYMGANLIWQLLLVNVIDPGYQERALDAAMEKAFQDMQDSGIPESQIEMSMEMTEKITSFFMKPLGQIMGLVLAIILYMVVNFLLALIVRREPGPGSPALDGDL